MIKIPIYRHTQITMPTDVPAKAKTQLPIFLRIIRILGIIIAAISSLIIGIHILATISIAMCCIMAPLVCYVHQNASQFSNSDNMMKDSICLKCATVSFAVVGLSGFVIVPCIIVYIVLLDGIDAKEWNGEIQSWMIAYIAWGITSFILISMIPAIRVFELTSKDKVTTILRTVYLVIGVDFGDVYEGIGIDLPLGESLEDVVSRVEKTLETIIDKAKNNNVLVVAHGNSIRAILKIVEDISDKDIVNVNIPTGIPLAFNVQDDKVSKIGYLGEQEQIKKLQKEVEQQSRITKG